MSASLAQVYASQGLNYYVRDNYYAHDKGVEHSEWYGKGAKELGLHGQIDAIKFQNLLDGYDAEKKATLTGEPIREYFNDKTGKNVRHRAAIDITFAPPKSFSIASLVHGEYAALEAHEAAVNKTLEMLEKYHSIVRDGDRKNRVKVATGNLVVAKFLHDTARGKNPDPHIHTHCLIISASKRADGNWRRLTTDTFFQNSAFINQFYMNSLAREAQQRGLNIVKTEKAFELQGYTRSQILEFSKRSQQIEALQAPTKSAERVLKLRTRPPKGEHLERDLLIPAWQQRAEKVHAVRPDFKSRGVSDFEKDLNLAQKKGAKRRVHESAFTGTLVNAAEKISQKNVIYTRNDVAAEVMRKEPGLFPSEAIFERVRTARELKPVQKQIVTLRDAFLSQNDLVKNQRVTPILPGIELLHKRKEQDVGIFPDVTLKEATEWTKKAGIMALDLGTTFSPFLGDIRDVYECVTGADALTGRKLSTAERVVTLGGMIAGSGTMNRMILNGAIRGFETVHEYVKEIQAEKRENNATNAEDEMRKWSEKYQLASLELDRGVEKQRRDPLEKQSLSTLQEKAVSKSMEKEKAAPEREMPVITQDRAPTQKQSQDVQSERMTKIEKDQQEYERLREIDPESAKWLKASIDSQKEQLEKAKNQASKNEEKLKNDPWKSVQIEEYLKESKEEKKSEKVKDKDKEIER